MVETAEQRRIRELEELVRQLEERERELEGELEAALNASFRDDDVLSAAASLGFDFCRPA